jgi:hypothetical protein
VRGPTPSNPAVKFIITLLRRVSEQARWAKWLGSQKKCGIFTSVQKDRCKTMKLCNKEFRALVIQDTSTSNQQSWGFMMTV